VTDLGIYNVVGGIVTLLAFFQSAQAKATSRFITYELGNDADEKQLKKTFSVCVTIHVLLAIGVVLLGETIGLWIVYHWLDIPADRFTAALWVYQFALLTFCIHMVRIPYDSVIIAHEDMSIYAYLSMLEAILQLGVVYCMKVINGDKLIFYSCLITLVAFSLFFIYLLYVRKKHALYEFSFTWDKNESLQIISFSGWTLLGSATNTSTQQGVNILMNNFVGLVANTALGFANQVNAALSKFVNSFTTAFNPQIIKLFAGKEYGEMTKLMCRASKFSFVLAYVMALPLIFNMDFVLHLWLGDVPQYTSQFCRLILICTVIDATTGVYNTAITATGNIKQYQIAISISFVLDLLCAFLLLKFRYHPATVFVSRILTRGLLNMIIGLFFCHKQLSFNISKYGRDVILPICITIMISLPLVYLIYRYFEGWWRLLFSIVISIFAVGICTLWIIMQKNERSAILRKIIIRN
jgi:O-antigen/teichoic acid export membrane protein